MPAPTEQGLAVARDFIAYVDASPTAAHCAAETARRLDAAGFRRVDERDRWDIPAGGRFYLVRNGTAVLAGIRGTSPAADAGFRMIGAHLDSPGLRVKPHGDFNRGGYRQLGVEIYGGVLLVTWLDRDLTLAGRLLVDTGKGAPEVKLVHVRRPICRIPNVAIHLNRDANDKFHVNKQQHMPLMLALAGDEKAPAEEDALLAVLAESAGVDKDKIVDYGLEVADTQGGAIGGLSNEFVYVGRIDNLASCHASIGAITAAKNDMPATRIAALFDAEEVGSNTQAGAGSNLMEATLERLTLLDRGESPREDFHRALARSFLISADGAHALNPNYIDKHEPQHQPVMGAGPVIKVNANERYTTTAASAEVVKRLADKAEVPVQVFVNRTDLGCGSTIGPITASQLGVRACDLGAPMLSMHSVRECTGTEDLHLLQRLCLEFYQAADPLIA